MWRGGGQLRAPVAAAVVVVEPTSGVAQHHRLVCWQISEHVATSLLTLETSPGARNQTRSRDSPKRVLATLIISSGWF